MAQSGELGLLRLVSCGSAEADQKGRDRNHRRGQSVSRKKTAHDRQRIFDAV